MIGRVLILSVATDLARAAFHGRLAVLQQSGLAFRRLSSTKSSGMFASKYTMPRDESSDNRIVDASRRSDDAGSASRGVVLMLHGWAQNAAVMKMKTKTLTKKMNQAGYDCVFLEAPHHLPMSNLEGAVELQTGGRENARAWFVLSETDPADASLSQSGLPTTYIGVDSSLSIVEDELGRCDGPVAVLGFSQGGVFVHVLSRLVETQADRFGKIRGVIVASGFAAQHVSDDGCEYRIGSMSDRTKLTMSSLHLIGLRDTSVDPKLSFDLVSLYKNHEVLLHEKGHIIPQKSADCAKIVAFLDRLSSQTS